MERRRLIVGISGATGAIYGIRLLEVLQAVDAIETHLIISDAAKITIAHETDHTYRSVQALSDVSYRFNDVAAAISSGSYPTLGMVVMPCSMKTLAGIASSYGDNLLLRAADVTLKDRRPLVVVPREFPLHLGHLRRMVEVTEMGGIVAPPVPAFYHLPATIDDIVNQTVARTADLLGIELDEELFGRWAGLGSQADS